MRMNIGRKTTKSLVGPERVRRGVECAVTHDDLEVGIIPD